MVRHLTGEVPSWAAWQWPLFEWLHGLDSPAWVAVMQALSQVGRTGAWLALVLACAVLWGWPAPGRWRFAGLCGLLGPACPAEGTGRARWSVALLAAGLGATLWMLALKGLLQWPRPEAVWGLDKVTPRDEVASPFGMPSGHAALAASWCWVLGWRAAWPVRLLLASLALAVGVSRVALGVHFPLDLVGGWLGGVLSGWLSGRWLLNPPGQGRPYTGP